VPVPGGTVAFAQALAIDPVPERGRFMFEITRLVHANPDIRNPAVAAFLQTMAISDRRGRHTPLAPGGDVVPVPLTAEVWSSAVFHRKVARDNLIAAIIADRAASLLCHGLGALDDQTLEYFSEHVSVLTRIAGRSAQAFAAFSGSLRIRANRVVPPGAPRIAGERDDATPLWEAVVGEKVSRPDRFIPQLFEASEGRLAYLFDTIGQLEPPRRAFALGSWMANPAVRADRFKVLATVGINAYREWHVRTQPFNRSSYDLGMTLMRVAVDDAGRPVAPASRAFWMRMFSGTDLPDDPMRLLRGLDEEPFDAAWLLETIGTADVRQRADRLDQIAFAQRMVRGPVADPADVFVAVRGLPRYRMLMLTLERIGVTAPAVYVAAARHAVRLGGLEGHRGFIAHAQFQGALALIARMRSVRTLDLSAAERLIERLASLPLSPDGRYVGAVSRWLHEDAGRAVGAPARMEIGIIAALAGPASANVDVTTRLTWEGQRYRLDLGAAERRRLQLVRDKQQGLPIDVALEVAATGRLLSGDAMSIDQMRAALQRIVGLAGDIPERARRDEEDNSPPGLGSPPETQAIVRKAADDLTKAVRNNDVKRAPRIGGPLLELSDELLAQALLSFAYAADLGDPDGTILLVDDVSRRHDFGFGGKDAEMRVRTAWSLPRQDVSPGVAWHVTGSLLGLDIALAPLALRRQNVDRVLEAPTLTSNLRDAFAVSVTLMNPFALTDAERDAIADAIDRGRRRVEALSKADEVDAMATDVAMEGARRRALAWTFVHERERVESLLSLTELLALGGARLGDFDAWGMSMLTTAGCLCSRLTPPGHWSTLLGRPQLGTTAAGLADVNLHVATRLKELQLPAALARVVLSGVMQDFIDQVKPTDEADWITMARTARAITREQIEDSAAAATAVGPLIPDEGNFPVRLQ